MKSKVILIFSILIFALSITCLSQNGSTTNLEDEEMNIFLSTLLIMFVCIMIGAGINATLLVALLFLLFFTFIAFGIISTSVIIGLYNRSISSGFKTFLIISFGLGSGILGSLGIIIVNEIFNLLYDNSVLSIIGFISGSVGGVILALITIAVIKSVIKHLKMKFINS